MLCIHTNLESYDMNVILTQSECEGIASLEESSAIHTQAAKCSCAAECCTDAMNLCDAHSREIAIDTYLLEQLTISLMINSEVSISV